MEGTGDVNHERPRTGRRGFLIGTGATLMAGALTACSTGEKKESSTGGGSDDLDVVVIGAGIAGLAAARHLTDGGKKVVVVEARDRIGGRMFTDRTSMPVPVDLGCEWIHGQDASTWDLVRQLGLKTHQDTVFATREKPGDPWKRTVEEDPRPGYRNFRIVGGYNQLLTPLAEKLSIRLNTVVKRVEYSSTGVTVHADRKGRPVTFKARAVIVAIPVAVLAADTVEFSPPLPPTKVEAFKSVPQESIHKVVMAFDRPVFPEDADLLGEVDVITDDSTPWYLLSPPKGTPGPEELVFTALIEGEETSRALALSRERRYAEVLDVIRNAMGDRKLQPVKVLEHEWFKDPFARAPYSKYGIPGEDLIYEPTGGSLYWAGIITESVDTSRDSGEEVAGEVLRRLGRK
ncbi:NAD(P)/FAD-dependent oxidoreductase [Streptomyces phaeochromogenes]|uniref:flavin monoamine oxidase family protein n=1 Tax=Streptomyces phaeochromogenes TaxID=1923 RepID=UPI0033EB384D